MKPGSPERAGDVGSAASTWQRSNPGLHGALGTDRRPCQNFLLPVKNFLLPVKKKPSRSEGVPPRNNSDSQEERDRSIGGSRCTRHFLFSSAVAPPLPRDVSALPGPPPRAAGAHAWRRPFHAPPAVSPGAFSSSGDSS